MNKHPITKNTRLRTIRPFIRDLFSPPARKIPQTGTAVDGPAAAATSSSVELSASDPPSIPSPLLQFPPMAHTHTHNRRCPVVVVEEEEACVYCVVTSTTALPESSPTFFIRRSPPSLPFFTILLCCKWGIRLCSERWSARSLVGGGRGVAHRLSDGRAPVPSKEKEAEGGVTCSIVQ